MSRPSSMPGSLSAPSSPGIRATPRPGASWKQPAAASLPPAPPWVLAEVYARDLGWPLPAPAGRSGSGRACPDGSAFPPTGLGYRPSRRGADAGAGRAAPAHRPPHPRRSARGDRPGAGVARSSPTTGRLAGLRSERRNRWTRVHPARAGSMIGLKPYPEYKDSGVPWLGEVPGHWDVRQLRDARDVAELATAEARTDECR